ncbi:hypothetical protein E2C01_035495 [Portunus trituberculatus]|uniref:Uncharacterized protein n=1 Tax=Portunus trituberculatus TaxID=210409 RepID=A0A5B7F8L5_PORTR|nr:hypothetical protein [Portunus trituberculatus]
MDARRRGEGGGAGGTRDERRSSTGQEDSRPRPRPGQVGGGQRWAARRWAEGVGQRWEQVGGRTLGASLFRDSKPLVLRTRPGKLAAAGRPDGRGTPWRRRRQRRRRASGRPALGAAVAGNMRRRWPPRHGFHGIYTALCTAWRRRRPPACQMVAAVRTSAWRPG